MHPFHAEIHARTELEARWRDADQRRAVAHATPRWSDRTGALLMTVGERFAAAGRRLQRTHRPAPVPCLEGC